MMKPRIYLEDGVYRCECAAPPYEASVRTWSEWLSLPVGIGDTPKEAFLSWYNQMVEQHIDE